MLNPYYWTQAAPTIIGSAIIPYATIRNVANTLKLIKMLEASLNTEGRYVLRASLQINTYNSFKEMVIQETAGIGWSNLVDFGYSYFGLNSTNGGWDHEFNKKNWWTIV